MRIIKLPSIEAVFPKKFLMFNCRVKEATYVLEDFAALVLWTFVFAMKTTVFNTVLWFSKQPVGCSVII